MIFVPYVFLNGIRTDVRIRKMTKKDADTTNKAPVWQTSWISDFIADKKLQKYAVLVDSELIALGAYEIIKNAMMVHIVYMEAHPASNPTLDHGAPKYTGIGRLLIAFGIKLSIDNGFGGTVVLEAKTTELARHYADDFGALELPHPAGVIPRFLISGLPARAIFNDYLKEG